jgi:hypothetical protein
VKARDLRLIASYAVLILYLVLLAFLAANFASNISALVASVVGGSITFTLIVALLAEHVPLLKSSFADILALFEFMSTIARVEVRWKVEGAVNNYREKLDKEVEGLLPYPMELRWVMSEEDMEPYLDQEKLVVVVRMKPRPKEYWNIASATLAYVSIGLVHEAKRYMDPALGRSIDFAFTQKLLEDEGETAAENYLIDQEIAPSMRENGMIQSYYSKLMQIADELLTRVFLREVGRIGKKLAAQKKGYGPDDRFSDDITAFLDWAVALAEREKGEEIPPLWFVSRNLKVGCILVSGEDTFLDRGPDPYVIRAQGYATKGTDAVYVLARGADIVYAKIVAKEIVRLTTGVGLVLVEGSEKTFKVKVSEGVVEAVALLLRPKLSS